MIILDTTVVIDFLRGHAEARGAARRAALSGERLAASVITRAEVIAGVRPHEIPATTALLTGLEWIPVDEQIAERAGWPTSTAPRTAASTSRTTSSLSPQRQQAPTSGPAT